MSQTPVVNRIRIIPRDTEFLERNVGSSGEIFYNKEQNTLRLYNGRLQGGFELAKNDLSNVTNADFLAKATAAGVSGGHSGGGAQVDVSPTAPTSPTEGNIWFNSNNGKIFVYINDGDTSQWVQPVSATPTIPTINTFSDVTVGATTLTASGDDELTFVAGSNITITANASTKEVTISAAGAAQQNLDTITTAGNTTTNDITVGGLFATSIESIGVGAPVFDSASTITFTAPDGIIFTDSVSAQGGLQLTSGTTATEFSVDGTFADNSDTAVPTEKAVKTYVDGITSTLAPINNTSLTGLTTLTKTTEVINTKTGATGTVVHDYTEGAIWYHTGITANFTPNFTNIPTTTSRAINVVLVLEQGGTGYGPSSVSINGVNYTPLIIGGGSLTYTANQSDIVSFTFIRVGTSWKVFASVNTYG